MKKFANNFFLFSLLIVAACHKDSDPTSSNVNIVPANFLSNTNYDKLVIEVQYMTGAQPSSAAVNNLTSFLQDRLNKTAGISIVQTTIASAGKATYSVSDVTAIENTSRTQKTSGKTLTAYILFVDGDYSDNGTDTKVLGITYGTTSMVIFEKTIQGFSGGLSKPSAATLETSVTQHEFGHVLGLVDRGTPLTSSHLDTAHDKHCTDKNCLMYYLAETSGSIAGIMNGSMTGLTQSCIDDLRGNGGK